MSPLLVALAFLTILPVPVRPALSGEEVGRASAFFPLAGGVQGLILVLAASLFTLLLPLPVVAGLVLAVHVLVTGGLHLDGLADSADALACRGGRERKLMIMKESRVGAMGVVAVALALILQARLLEALLAREQAPALAILFLMPVLGRWAMVTAMAQAQPARPEGLGRLFLEHTGRRQLALASLGAGGLALAAVALAAGGWQLAALLAVASVGLCGLARGIVRLAHQQLGGMTGDTFGALAVLADLVLLTVAVAGPGGGPP
ncbi:MAG: adenosylcobinamide-GDP ribazoletransferase [Thermodesulfobacteriota bacterium]